MFKLTDDQVSIQEMAATLADAEVKANAAESDEAAAFPKESMKVIAESGLNGILLPESVGGAEMDEVAMVLAISEISRNCTSSAAILSDSFAVQAAIMTDKDSRAYKDILPLLAEGKCASLALYDKDMDSTEKDIATMAEEKDGGFVLKGEKRGVVNIDNADYYLTAANVNDKGLTLFIIPSDTAGIDKVKIHARMGQRAVKSGTLVFDGCKVNNDSVVGGVGKGADILARIKDIITLSYAAQAAGLSRGALENAIRYVNERMQFGKRISEFENTQQMLAYFQAKTEAAMLLLLSAASDVAEGAKDASAKAAMAKVVACDTAGDTVRKCSQFMGGFGYSREYPLERMIRDSKIIEVYGGGLIGQKRCIAESIGVC